MNNNGAYDWNSTITQDSEVFLLLEPGEYTATVEEVRKEWHEGSTDSKIRNCPKAVVVARIETPEGVARINTNLLLHQNLEWKLSQFFTSIGLKQKGQPLVMDWNKVVGKQAKIKVKNTPGWKDPSQTYNEIDAWLPPEEILQATQTSFSPGKF